MNRRDAIDTHEHALPRPAQPKPQQEMPNWMEAVEQRRVLAAAAACELTTETLIARLTGIIADDFPDEIEELDGALDAPRDTIE